MALWLALALYLTAPPMNYGTDVVGYLAAIAAVSILSTPRLGRWADVIGARKARFFFAVVQLAGISLFWPLGGSIWGLLVPLVIVNLVGPGVDVTGRMTFLSREPELRTRLTTVYIVIMFVGGGLGSVLGTAVYDLFGWGGVCGMLVASSSLLTALCWFGTRFGR
jgi:predicted MFS family arabinose efflux permease